MGEEGKGREHSAVPPLPIQEESKEEDSALKSGDRRPPTAETNIINPQKMEEEKRRSMERDKDDKDIRPEGEPEIERLEEKKDQNLNKFLEEKEDEVRIETGPKETETGKGKLDITDFSETIPEQSSLSGPSFFSQHREESPEQPHIRTNLHIDKLNDQL